MELYVERGFDEPPWQKSPNEPGSRSARSSGTSPKTRGALRRGGHAARAARRRGGRRPIGAAARGRSDRRSQGRRCPHSGTSSLCSPALRDHCSECGTSRAGAHQVASLSVALADTLRRRGVADHAASLAAEVAVAVFKITFERSGRRPDPSRPAPTDRRVTRRAQVRDCRGGGGTSNDCHCVVGRGISAAADNTVGDEQHPPERLPALDVGVGAGGVGERERPVDDHLELAARRRHRGGRRSWRAAARESSISAPRK